MRLLIDEMFAVSLAEALRSHGHDAVSVVVRQDLKGSSDEEIFALAQLERRAVVTENVRDFRPIAHEWIRAGKVHHGVIFTTNRRFPRGQDRTKRRLIAALLELLERDEPSGEPSNREIWL